MGTAGEKVSVWSLGGLSWMELFKRVWDDFNKHRVADQSAQLSYYFIFAIFPLLLFLVALLGLFLEPGSVIHQALTKYLSAIAPKSASGLIDSVLKELFQKSGAGKLSIGLLAALWSASSGMSALIHSLNVAYGVTQERPWWKEKLLSIMLTVGFCLSLMVALVLAVYGGSIAGMLAQNLGFGALFTWAWNILQWPVLFFFAAVAFNLVYYFAPNVRHVRWHWLMPGTVVALVLWLAASLGLKLYLSFSNTYSVTYGSIGTVIILLLWFYVSGIAILIGGEVNSEVEKALAASAR